MANVTMHGNTLSTNGDLPGVGQSAPDFSLTGTDMKPVSLGDSSGKVRVVSVVPSVDTGVCSLQTARFNHEMDSLPENVVGITVSVDTPFAQKRWCAAEGAEKMQMLSDFKDHSFGKDYGLYIEGAGINARAVLIIDADGKVAYTQLVPEISQEPNYDEVLQKARELAS
jgi:thiol peroxidase